MNRAETMSVIALAVSVLSFFASIFFNIRDRAKIVANAKYLQAWEENCAHVVVAVVNAGRRPIILRLWRGAESDGESVGTFLGEMGKGLRLEEHERYEFILEKHDLYIATPDDNVSVQDIWFEDTLGRIHTVRNAKASIAKLWTT